MRSVEIRAPERSKNRGVEPRSKGSSDVLDDILPELDALTGAGKGRGKKIDPVALEELVHFRTTLKDLRTKAGAESDDYRSDLATKAMLRAMLSQVFEMLPTAVEKYIKEQNESAAYAFNALANQAKDLNAQLRSLDTLEEQADHITTRIMTPAMIMLTQSLLNALLSTKSRVDNFDMTPKDRRQLKELLDTMVREHGKYMEEQLKSLNLQIKQYLLGEAEAPKRVSKRAT